jgi:hypothetical protein
MGTLSLLGTTLGFAFAAGLNLYATVLVIGLAVRLDWLPLPAGMANLEALGHPAVLSVAALMYVIEFLADKVPAVDHLWDVVHSFIRPAGAAWIAWRTVGGAGLPEPIEVAFLLAAGGVALSTHVGKAGTRLAVGATGGHVTGAGIGLSLLEDILAFIVTPLAILIPLLILLFVLFSVFLTGWVVWRIGRRRRSRRAVA